MSSRPARAGDPATPLELDVLVVGGGIQGLSVLRELKARGVRSSFLLTDDVIGAGETLHSHGYMMRGYMLPPEAPRDAVAVLDAAVSAWTKLCGERAIAYGEDHPTYFAAPDASREASWRAAGLPFERLAKAPPPFARGSYASGGVLYKVNDRVFSAELIVQALVKELAGHIGRGRVTRMTLRDTHSAVDVVEANIDGRRALLRPRHVVLAAGTANQPLLRALGRAPPPHLVRNVPMVLLRAGDLPNATGMFLDAQLSLATHRLPGGELMWVATPAGGHSTTRNDVAVRGEPPVEKELVKATLSRLASVFSRDAFAHAKVSVYFGAKIDHPDGAARWFVGDAGLDNLRYVWPVLWSLSHPAAVDVVAQLERTPAWASMIEEKRPLAAKLHALAKHGTVGAERRAAKDLRWSSLEQVERW